jgi:hypothetical protein
MSLVIIDRPSVRCHACRLCHHYVATRSHDGRQQADQAILDFQADNLTVVLMRHLDEVFKAS